MACGVPPLAGPLTPPFTYSNFIVNAPGTAGASAQFDSNDFFGNGLFDDNTSVTMLGITWATCGSPPPAVQIVTRNRIILPFPFLASLNNVTIIIIDTWTGIFNPVTYRNGAQLNDGIILGAVTPLTLLRDVSGVYTLIKGKRVDTLQDRQPGQTSIDVEIPDPTFKTGYIGG